MDKHYIDLEVDRRSLSVEHIDTGSWGGPQPTMIRLTEEDVYPGWSMVLSVDEARWLARHLLETADEAENRNWEAESKADEAAEAALEVEAWNA